MTEHKAEKNYLVMIKTSYKNRGESWFVLGDVVATGPFTKEESEKYCDDLNDLPRRKTMLIEAYIQELPFKPGLNV